MTIVIGNIPWETGKYGYNHLGVFEVDSFHTVVSDGKSKGQTTFGIIYLLSGEKAYIKANFFIDPDTVPRPLAFQKGDVYTYKQYGIVQIKRIFEEEASLKVMVSIAMFGDKPMRILLTEFEQHAKPLEEKCRHENAYFVGSVGEEYCPDCEEYTGVCD